VARLFGTLEGAKSTASRTGEDRLTARLATWHGAVVLTLDDYGTWTVHTEPAVPQEAGAAVPAVVARGNVHAEKAPPAVGSCALCGEHGPVWRYGPRGNQDACRRCACLPNTPPDGSTAARPNRSPSRRPGRDWTPYTTTEERSPTA